MSNQPQNPLQSPWVQLALQAVCIFGVMLFIRAKLPFLAFVVVVLAALAALVIWLLRYNAAALAGVYHVRPLHWFIDRIALWSGLQPPTSGAVAVSAGGTAPAQGACLQM